MEWLRTALSVTIVIVGMAIYVSDIKAVSQQNVREINNIRDDLHECERIHNIIYEIREDVAVIKSRLEKG